MGSILQIQLHISGTQRAINELGKTETKNDGTYIADEVTNRSEQYGHHKGLIQAAHCFAESYDIYLAAHQMDQANRQRRFLGGGQTDPGHPGEGGLRVRQQYPHSRSTLVPPATQTTLIPWNT